MTQEEKSILLRDLCARLPYGVKFACNKNVYTAKGLNLIVTDEGDWEYAVTAKGIEPIEIGFIKPYLRPMSSMTEEEEVLFRCELPSIAKTDAQLVAMRMELFLKGHLDFNHLIEKGLALEASKGMYQDN